MAGARPLTEQLQSVRQLLDDEQWFLAYDAAREAIADFPDERKFRHWAAQALIRLGALAEARKLLEAISPHLNPHTPQFRDLYARFRAAARDAVGGAAGDPPSRDSLEAFAELLGGWTAGGGRGLHRPADAGEGNDEETLGLLGRVYKDVWRETGRVEDARRCRDVYLDAARRTGGHWTCANAATMSRALGWYADRDGQPDLAREERAQADSLAARALAICDAQLPALKDEERSWALTSVAEASLLRGDEPAAFDALSLAMTGARRRDYVAARTTEQLRLLDAHGCPVSPRIFELLKPPTVVVFAGHLIDRADRPSPRFPPEVEQAVRLRIDAVLEALGARIGYSSAACGGDLLFIEAMLDRDAEANVVLPFAADDYLRESIAYAGPGWVRRFRRALKLATQPVRYATTEPYLGADDLFAFSDQILHGFACFRAHSSGTQPHLLAVLDRSSPRLKGGTADIVARWPDAGRLHVIDLAELVWSHRRVSPSRPVPAATPAVAPPPAAAEAGPPCTPGGACRVVRTMLFADIVGFSRMQEEQVPYYMFEFLNEVARQLGKLATKPRMVNTWGDAIFAVLDTALPAVAYARELRRVVCETDWPALGLPKGMNVRIALHAGPVFEGTDAVTSRPNCFGSHVNRAARIEPITLPGHIYASQQFVAMLAAEQRVAAAPAGGWPFACDYLGTVKLAKNFGDLPVYHVRDRHAGGPANR